MTSASTYILIACRKCDVIRANNNIHLFNFVAVDERQTSDDIDIVYPRLLSTSGHVIEGHEQFLKQHIQRSTFRRASGDDDVINSGFNNDLSGDRTVDRQSDSSLENNNNNDKKTLANDGDDASRRRYSLTAFARPIELQLVHDASFISPGVVVERIDGGGGDGNSSRRWTRSATDASHCYFTGKVKDDPYSSASLSLCGQMVSLLDDCCYCACACKSVF